MPNVTHSNSLEIKLYVILSHYKCFLIIWTYVVNKRLWINFKTCTPHNSTLSHVTGNMTMTRNTHNREIQSQGSHKYIRKIPKHFSVTSTSVLKDLLTFWRA